jgi:hypothetical protein
VGNLSKKALKESEKEIKRVREKGLLTRSEIRGYQRKA